VRVVLAVHVVRFFGSDAYPLPPPPPSPPAPPRCERDHVLCPYGQVLYVCDMLSHPCLDTWQFGRRRRGGCNTAGDGSTRIERRLVTPTSAADSIFETPTRGRCDAATTAESSAVLSPRGAAPAPRATASLSLRGPTAARGGPSPTWITAVEDVERCRAGPTGFPAPPGVPEKFRRRRTKLNGHGGYVRVPVRARQRRGYGRSCVPCWACGGVEWLCGGPAGGAARAMSVAWAARTHGTTNGRRGFDLNPDPDAVRRAVAIPAAAVNRLPAFDALNIPKLEVVHGKRLEKSNAKVFYPLVTCCAQARTDIDVVVRHLERYEPRLGVCVRSWGPCCLP